MTDVYVTFSIVKFQLLNNYGVMVMLQHDQATQPMLQHDPATQPT